MANDPNDTTRSLAEATKSVSDTVRLGITVTDKAIAWLARMLREDAAGLLKDQVFYWRAKNALDLQDKLDRILEIRHLENPKAIPLRLAIPFLKSATLEDDSTLQDRWAGLLANAMDPTCKIKMERYFGSILEDLSPSDCLVLDLFGLYSIQAQNMETTPQALATKLAKDEEEICIALGNLFRQGLVERRPREGMPIGSLKTWSFVHGAFYLTELGKSFLLACSVEEG